MVERCARRGSDLKIKFRTILLTSISLCTTLFLFLMFFWCPCVAINVSLQYNVGLLPDILLLIQCYYHRGTHLNAMKRFGLCSL